MVVPLIIPAIHSMRLALRPSRTALIIGTPPATAASNATITPCFCASANISLPYIANNALFAVTTCLPLAIALSTNSLATPQPPISSITISTSGSLTTANASSTTRQVPCVISLARTTSFSATTTIRIGRPARREISSALRDNTVNVPAPTVPIPSRPTFIGFIIFYSKIQFVYSLPLGSLSIGIGKS